MKPRSPSTGGKGRFPHTDYFFHSGFGQWQGGYFSPYDGERAKEMAVFALIVLTSAWPVLYMVVTVVKLLSKGRP